jgi:hypothetical protein
MGTQDLILWIVLGLLPVASLLAVFNVTGYTTSSDVHQMPHNSLTLPIILHCTSLRAVHMWSHNTGRCMSWHGMTGVLMLLPWLRLAPRSPQTKKPGNEGYQGASA